jgi:PAS domain S-box-containing protein
MVRLHRIEKESGSKGERKTVLDPDTLGTKKSTEAAHNYAIKYRALLDNMDSGVALYETIDDGHTFIIEDINTAAERIEGVTREEVIGRDVADVFPGIHDLGLLEVFRRVWSTGISEHHGVKPYTDTRAGSWRDNFVYKLPTGEIVAIYSDVSTQKAAEEALTESESRYRTLVETINDGLAAVDENGVITFANSRLCEILGYTKEEIVGTRRLDYVAPDVREKAEEEFIERRRGTATVYETVLITKDGRRVRAIASGRPLLDEQQRFKGSYVVITDISDLRTKEKELQDKIEELTAINTLAENTASSLSPADVVRIAQQQLLSALSADLIVVYLKKGNVLELQGDALSTTELKHDGPDTKAVGQCLCGTSAEQGRPIYSSDIFTDPRCTLNECKEAGIRSFAALPLLYEDEILGVIGVASLTPRDFSLRSEFLETAARQIALAHKNAALFRQVEEHAAELDKSLALLQRSRDRLSESEERFRAIFEGAQDLIFLMDGDRRYTHANPSMVRLFGSDPSDIVGRRPEDLFGREAEKHLKQGDMRVLQGETIEDEHTRPVRGALRTFHEIRVPLKDADGNIVGICGVARDITDRKRTASPEPITARDYPSRAMRSALLQASYAASSDSIVLLQGESGSGKDYLAQWIHKHSSRAGGPFFTINCAAVPKELAESELFGHEAGAFSGARGRKKGLLELAEGGTLLLNEIGELPLTLQSKLLTFLDSKSFLRVGGQKTIRVNARLIAATHRDLKTEVEQQRFLEPLYYRINVFTIRVPPLRDRTEDIPILVDEILARLAGELQLPNVPLFDQVAIRALTEYHWPGNVRELRNVIERALMVPEGVSLKSVLPAREAGSASDSSSLTIRIEPGRSLRQVTDEVMKPVILETLKQANDNRSEAARMLGISRESLYRHMRRLGIQ